MFRGFYHEKCIHEDDLKHVIERATEVGCCKMMVTGSDLIESKKAVELASEQGKSFLDRIYA